MFADIIGWIGTIVMFSGSITNIYKHNSCWYLWIIGGTGLIIQALLLGTYNILTLQLLYMPLNVFGWIQWRKSK
jgi:hypothetical protein